MIDRRTFLQVSGGLGLASWLWPWLEAGAAPRGRQLALLIGIDHYRSHNGEEAPDNLRGCRTDVDLQRELWQSRYGLGATDIVTLLDGQATPTQVETAFREHLGQASPGDRVIFHFSGYGVVQNGATGSEELALLLGAKGVGFSLNLLQSLIRSLKTDQVIVILDSGFGEQPSAWVGNFRCRNLLGNNILVPPGPTLGKGVWLWGASPQQAVLEWPGAGFEAGLFTYALTRTLWQAQGPQKILTLFHQSNALLLPWVGDRQNPQLQALKTVPPWSPEPSAGGVGRVTQSIDSQNLALSLPGVDPILLATGVLNSYYQVGTTAAWVQITEQSGLGAKARALKVLEGVVAGDLVREGVRSISRHLKLTVALGESLNRIERVDATSALGDIDTVGTVLNIGEGPADCVLAKCADGGYRLLNMGGQALLDGGASKSTAIKAALGELPQQLTTLLALKYLRLTANEGTTGLAARAILEVLAPNGSKPLTQRLTAAFSPPLAIDYENYFPVLTPGDRLQFRLRQSSSSPLFLQIIGITPQGKMFLLGGNLPRLESHSDLILPGGLFWPISRPLGWGQTFILLSRVPYQHTQQILSPTESPQVQEVEAPLEMVQALLQDLDAQALPIPRPHDPETYYLNLQAWAGLTFIYRNLAQKTSS